MGKKNFAMSEGIREGDATQAPVEYKDDDVSLDLIDEQAPPPSSPHATEPAPATPSRKPRGPLSKRAAVNLIFNALERVEGGKQAQDDVLASVAALR